MRRTDFTRTPLLREFGEELLQTLAFRGMTQIA